MDEEIKTAETEAEEIKEIKENTGISFAKRIGPIGIAFFLFLFVAALSTLVAVFENLVAYGMDEYRWSRKKSTFLFGALLTVLSFPCVFGYNLWSCIQPFGKGSTILDLEDFIVSNNLLPLGALYLTVFCMNRYGWGKEKCLSEINTGKGLKFSRYFLPYITWILPLIILAIWFTGIIGFFS